MYPCWAYRYVSTTCVDLIIQIFAVMRRRELGPVHHCTDGLLVHSITTVFPGDDVESLEVVNTSFSIAAWLLPLCGYLLVSRSCEG